MSVLCETSFCFYYCLGPKGILLYQLCKDARTFFSCGQFCCVFWTIVMLEGELSSHWQLSGRGQQVFLNNFMVLCPILLSLKCTSPCWRDAASSVLCCRTGVLSMVSCRMYHLVLRLNSSALLCRPHVWSTCYFIVTYKQWPLFAINSSNCFKVATGL